MSNRTEAQRTRHHPIAFRVSKDDRAILDKTAELVGVPRGTLARLAVMAGIPLIGRRSDAEHATDSAWRATRLALASVVKGLEEGRIKAKPADAIHLAKTAKLLSDHSEEGADDEDDLRQAYSQIRLAILSRFGPEALDDLDAANLIDVTPQ